MEFIYCAFCKHRRKAYLKKSVGLRDIGMCLLLSALLMLSVWQSFHSGVFFIFFILLSICEVAIHFRKRVSMECKICGFDPVLYVRSPHLAEKKVKDLLEQKKQSPDFYLAKNNPFAHLPTRSVDKSNLKNNP